MRVLALILAGSAVAGGAALLDFMLFVNHAPVKAGTTTLWTCARIAGGSDAGYSVIIGCLSD